MGGLQTWSPQEREAKFWFEKSKLIKKHKNKKIKIKTIEEESDNCHSLVCHCQKSNKAGEGIKKSISVYVYDKLDKY